MSNLYPRRLVVTSPTKNNKINQLITVNATLKSSIKALEKQEFIPKFTIE
jgi:hypothetical protein